ncbi:unnamed protein product [Adineta steineri]|uniref:Uncharacterized protein n=1 Tax=Adineta steineri TaxID=433720 RepID=A0A815GD95_9BILA|nr:unnamed protein product [Adineta steineri]CAF1591616.1 unnamed protein product [Adineta steineri]
MYSTISKPCFTIFMIYLLAHFQASDRQHRYSFEVVNNEYVDKNGNLINDRIPRLKNFFKRRINSYTYTIDVVKAQQLHIPQQLGQQYQDNTNNNGQYQYDNNYYPGR